MTNAGRWAIGLLSTTAFGISATAFAWGTEGHQVVARVAQRHLTPAAAATVARMLPGPGGMSAVANWADCIRNRRDCAADDGLYDEQVHGETEPWHYVDIALNAAAYSPARDCPESRCIVAKIADFQTALAAPETSAGDRLLALKFLIHFVGDIHQPLHDEFDPLPDGKSDAGGNLRFVKPPAGKATTLHVCWDSSLLYDELATAGGNPSAYADTIDAGPPIDPGPLDPAAWANQGHLLARQAYFYPGAEGPHGFTMSDPVPLDAAYLADSRAIVRQQVRIAGVRLAAILNKALDTGRHPAR